MRKICEKQNKKICYIEKSLNILLENVEQGYYILLPIQAIE